MEKKKNVIDISVMLEQAKKDVVDTSVVSSFQTNPIYKKLLAFSNTKLKDKFSFEDLFR